MGLDIHGQDTKLRWALGRAEVEKQGFLHCGGKAPPSVEMTSSWLRGNGRQATAKARCGDFSTALRFGRNDDAFLADDETCPPLRFVMHSLEQ
jgi:hypothetical protein